MWQFYSMTIIKKYSTFSVLLWLNSHCMWLFSCCQFWVLFTLLCNILAILNRRRTSLIPQARSRRAVSGTSIYCLGSIFCVSQFSSLKTPSFKTVLLFLFWAIFMEDHIPIRQDRSPLLGRQTSKWSSWDVVFLKNHSN